MLRDYLKQLAERPVHETPRQDRMVVGIALLLVLAVFALVAALTPSSEPARSTARQAQPASSEPPTAVAPTPHRTDTVSARDLSAAKRAARRFLSGYLPYTYGHCGVHCLPGSSRELRARLASIGAPRVPPSVRRLRPRITGPLRIDEDQPAAPDVAVTALVRDGKRSYTVRVLLERARGRWRAVGIG